MSRQLLISTCTATAILVVAGAVAAPVQTDHVRAELISETTALAPGQHAWLALRLIHEPHWHTYWTNPGDSGLATKLIWQLPDGFDAGEIAWPTPQRFDVGGLFNFGYSGDALLPVPLEVPADAQAGSTAYLAVEAKWLVCREECVPGKAMLELDLPIVASAAPDPHWQAEFAAARAAQPHAGAWTGTARDVGDHIEVTLRGAGLPSTDALDAFVVQRQIVGYAPPQFAQSADALTVTFAKSDYFTTAPDRLDLLLLDARRADAGAWSASVPFAANNSPSARP